MKKIIGLLSIIILALALVACGNNEETQVVENNTDNNEETSAEDVDENNNEEVTNTGEEDSEGTRTFEIDEEGVYSLVGFTFKGDEVTKQTSENIYPYEMIADGTTEGAKEHYDAISDSFQGYDGLTYKVEYTDTEIHENLKIDYTTINMEEIKHLHGMDFDEDVINNGISMQNSVETAENLGFTEVK